MHSLPRLYSCLCSAERARKYIYLSECKTDWNRTWGTHVLARLPPVQQHRDGRSRLLDLGQLAHQAHTALVEILLNQPVVLVALVQLLYHLIS